MQPPEVNAIISTYEAGAPQVYWERRVADLERPNFGDA